jgi:hypothetical protein
MPRNAWAAPFAIGFVTLTGACGGEEGPPPQAPPPPTLGPPAQQPAASGALEPGPAAAPKPSLVELIPKTWRGLGDAFNAHDPDKFASYFTDDAAIDTYGLPEVIGRTALIESLQQEFAVFPDNKGFAARSFQKGNVGIAEVVVSGTMAGESMGIKPTKRAVGDRRMIVARFNDDGLITHWHAYVDVAGRVAQMKGARVAPPVPPLPSSAPEEHAGRNTPDEDKLVEWVTGANATLSSGDLQAASSLFAADGDLTLFLLGGRTVKGKDIGKFNADLFRAVPAAKFGVVGAW